MSHLVGALPYAICLDGAVRLVRVAAAEIRPDYHAVADAHAGAITEAGVVSLVEIAEPWGGDGPIPLAVHLIDDEYVVVIDTTIAFGSSS